MNIAFLAFAEYPWRSGGVNKSIDNLTSFLTRAGHSVSVYCLPNLSGSKRPMFDPASHGVQVIPIDEPWLRFNSVPLFGGLATVRALESFGRRAIAALESGPRPDVIVAEFTCAPAALEFGARTSVPVVVVRWAHWAHEIKSLSRSTRLLGRRLHATEDRVFSDVRSLVVDGPDLYEDALERGLPESAVHLIPAAVDLDSFSPPEEFRLPEPEGHGGSTVVLFPSMLRDIKGFDHLLRAFAALPGSERQDAVVVATGRGDKAPYAELANELGIGDAVVFLGEVSDSELPLWFARSQVAVFPYLFGAGYSVAGIEAFAAGLPVVAYDVQAFSALIEHGVNGLLVPVGDVPAFSAALGRVLGDTDLRERMGQAARERSFEFGIETVGAKFERLLVDLVGGAS